MSKPQPLPIVARALLPLKDAGAAVARGLDAWNVAQLEDAIRSAEFFIGKAKGIMDQSGEPELKLGAREGGAA